ERCQTNGQCCANLTCGQDDFYSPKTCRPGCAGLGEPCGAACCSGLACPGGRCEPICGALGELCTGTGGCCGDGRCEQGLCRACRGRHVSCASTDDCCDRMTCTAGTCT